MFHRKKQLFNDLDLTIITPSKWLANLVKESFLKDYPVVQIHNGIDLSVFKPTQSDFRQRYQIPDHKHLILGVAFDWGIRKGVDAFIALSKRLDAQYQIVLIGTNDLIDKLLPPNVISIHRTNNQRELAQIYSAADVFVNPTREEVLGMVNIEALACGTPVITFDSGGSPETIDHTCGSIVPCDDVEALADEILRVSTEKPYTREDCLNRAKVFDQNEKYREYLKLYQSI